MDSRIKAWVALSALGLSALFFFSNLTGALNHHDGIPLDSKQVEQMITSLLSSTASYGQTNTSQRQQPLQPQPIDGVVPRAFEPWPADTPLPCFDPHAEVDVTKNETCLSGTFQKRPPLAGQGLFYLKLTKSASSTAAGVHLRIARNAAQRQTVATWPACPPVGPLYGWAGRNTLHHHAESAGPMCRVRFLHGWAGPKMFRYSRRDRLNGGSFLWTTLREPTARAVSEFFHFQVGRRRVAVNEQAWKRFARHGPHADHHSLSWLAVEGYRYGTSDPMATANAILQQYDFIGLVERLDESLVVLSLLLGVPLRDVLYLPAKLAGTYDDLCVKIPPARLKPPMLAHIQSDEWQSYVAPEVALWKAANASLDLTIDQLGRGRVEPALQRFRDVMQVIQKTCGGGVTRFPCGADGVPNNETDCLFRDMGCGWDCIDRVADEMNLP